MNTNTLKMLTDFRSQRVWGPKQKYPLVLDYKEHRVPMIFPIVIAGPCSLENNTQIECIAQDLEEHGVTFMRGGLFRAGTYPPQYYGFRDDLLRQWRQIADYHRLKIIIEVLDVRHLDRLNKFADAFQVGARHMQDYVLLKELSQTGKVVTLKRNMGATLDEFLGATEYLLQGNCQPVLIERGSSTYHNHVRWELSVSIIAAVKQFGLPILVDASHGSGRRDLVEPLTMAGIAAGADGCLVEVHNAPEYSISDADQALPAMDYGKFLSRVKSMFDFRRGNE